MNKINQDKLPLTKINQKQINKNQPRLLHIEHHTPRSLKINKDAKCPSLPNKSTEDIKDSGSGKQFYLLTSQTEEEKNSLVYFFLLF